MRWGDARDMASERNDTQTGMNPPVARHVLRGLALLFVFPAAVFAQRDTTALVRGVVTDSGGHPLESVEISATTIGRLARTDSEGRFTIGGMLAGRNRLLIRRLGWKALDTTIVVDPKSPPVVRLTLARLAQDLQTVHIVSQDECPTRTLEGFECRRRAGLGAFRDSAEIAALHPVCAADIVYGMQGLKRVPGSPCPSFVPTTGWRCLQILVDGRVLDRGNMPPKLMSDYTNDLPGAVAAGPQVLAPGVQDALRAQIRPKPGSERGHNSDNEGAP